MPLTKDSMLIGSHVYFAREGGTINADVTSASRARASNIATIVTDEPHGLFVGASVTLTGFSGVGYNIGPVDVATVINSTSFTIPCVAADEATTADTGGNVNQTGTVSSSARPGPNDDLWTEIGVIDSASVAQNKQQVDVWGPRPGKLVRVKKLLTKRELVLKFSSQEYSPLAAEVLYHTEALSDSSTQFNPLSGSDKRGWLKTQRYDQDDTLIEVIDTWGLLEIDGDVSMGGEDVVKPQFLFSVESSSLNTGAL